MSRIYRAFVNGKEITRHYLNGKEINEVWGNGTLLWKKNGRPFYSQYFIVNDCVSKYGDHLIDEYGAMLVFNEGAEITKCGVYLTKKGGNQPGYHRTLACRGKNITYAMYVPYLAYRGEVIYDGRYTAGIKTYNLSQYVNGVWTYNYYSLIYADLSDKNGNLLTINSMGYDTKNVRLFTDLDEMKDWLNTD